MTNILNIYIDFEKNNNSCFAKFKLDLKSMYQTSNMKDNLAYGPNY